MRQKCIAKKTNTASGEFTYKSLGENGPEGEDYGLEVSINYLGQPWLSAIRWSVFLYLLKYLSYRCALILTFPFVADSKPLMKM